MAEKLTITYIPVSDIKPYKRNAKQHPAEQVAQIANSIREFGMNDPIAVDEDNVIIEGHGRLLAVQKLMKDGEYHEDTIPCIRLDGLTTQQKRAYILAHNKLTMNTGFDLDTLNAELSDIIDFDMSDFGFIDDMTAEIVDAETSEDDYDIEAHETNVMLGDVYRLGEHILVCGDSTDPGTAEKLMGDEKAAMLFTSPPYVDMRNYNGGKDLSVSHLAEFISAFRPYTDYQCVNLGIQRRNNDLVTYWDEYIRVAKAQGYNLMAWNVWDKLFSCSIGQASAFFPIRHEWIFVFGTEFYEINLTVPKKPVSIQERGFRTGRQKDGTLKHHTTGDTTRTHKQMESVTKIEDVSDATMEKLSSVIEQGPERRQSITSLHPATFPVELPGEYIKAMTHEGDIVIEPFGGSGSTLIACEQLKRRCRIVELDPVFADVIIQRWEQFTGKKAELIG